MNDDILFRQLIVYCIKQPQKPRVADGTRSLTQAEARKNTHSDILPVASINAGHITSRHSRQ